MQTMHLSHLRLQNRERAAVETHQMPYATWQGNRGSQTRACNICWHPYMRASPQAGPWRAAVAGSHQMQNAAWWHSVLQALLCAVQLPLQPSWQLLPLQPPVMLPVCCRPWRCELWTAHLHPMTAVLAATTPQKCAAQVAGRCSTTAQTSQGGTGAGEQHAVVAPVKALHNTQYCHQQIARQAASSDC